MWRQYRALAVHGCAGGRWFRAGRTDVVVLTIDSGDEVTIGQQRQAGPAKRPRHRCKFFAPSRAVSAANPHTLCRSPTEGFNVPLHFEQSPHSHIPGPGEQSLPELEVDQSIAPRPEEEIADVLRAKLDVEDHSEHRVITLPESGANEPD